MSEQAEQAAGQGGLGGGAAGYGPHESAGYWVQRLATSMSEHFVRGLTEHGLSVGLWPILGALHSENAATPSEVAKFLGMDPSAVTRQLDRLEKSGLLVRIRKETDRRSVSLQLTPEGRALATKLASMSRETNERFLIGVTDEEHSALRDTIRKMLRNADGPVEDL